MITDRNLPADTLLKARYKGVEHLLKVLAPAEGETEPRFELLAPRPAGADQYFTSLSKAGNAVTGTSVNGWRFWTLAAPPAGKVEHGQAGEPSPEGPRAARRARQRAEKPAPATDTAATTEGEPEPATPKRRARKPRTFNPIRRMKDGRFWCSACQNSYVSEDPDEAVLQDSYSCPFGHNVGEMRLQATEAVEDAGQGKPDGLGETARAVVDRINDILLTETEMIREPVEEGEATYADEQAQIAADNVGDYPNEAERAEADTAAAEALAAIDDATEAAVE